jgi:hypothetical protein
MQKVEEIKQEKLKEEKPLEEYNPINDYQSILEKID